MVNEIFLKNKYLCLVIGITVTVLLFTIISIFGIDKKLVVVLVALPVFTLGLFNINAAIVLGISLLFLEIDLFKSRVAVFAFIPILLSFAINHKASQNHSI
ncbi:MAG TPA: hypothetical protein VHO70_24280, partial [Chitinispirillaceae bacterium]|nr:hypothetical protein [Chitinispirillaceae bacterium]